MYPIVKGKQLLLCMTHGVSAGTNFEQALHPLPHLMRDLYRFCPYMLYTTCLQWCSTRTA